MTQLSLFTYEMSLKKTEESTQVCKTCDIEKPLSSFSFASGGNYRHRTCKSCTNEHVKVRQRLRLENPLPDKDYCCPICQKKKNDLEHLNNPNQVVWSLDHDWRKGTFRGYICHSCNRALGIFQDDKETLERAIKYLEG